MTPTRYVVVGAHRRRVAGLGEAGDVGEDPQDLPHAPHGGLLRLAGAPALELLHLGRLAGGGCVHFIAFHLPGGAPHSTL